MSDRAQPETVTVSDVTELVVIPPSDALAIFTAQVTDGEPHPIDKILARIRAEIEAFEPDLSTKTSRARIASMAYRVARAKTALDDAGKELVAEQKKIPNRIDATRRYVKTKLEMWQADVRKPLDDWETAENARIAGHTANLDRIGAWTRDVNQTATVLRERVAAVEAVEVTETACEEFLDAYRTAKAHAISTLGAALVLRERYEAEQAELAALRREKEERAKIEREADERAEAQAAVEERARELAQKERDAAVAREAKLKAEIEEQKRRAEEAERRASDGRVAAGPALPDPGGVLVAAPQPLADKATVNRAALDAMVAAGIEHDIAKQVVILIAMGRVPRVTINYGGA